MDELPEAEVTSGPIESVLSRFQCILANALAVTGACHPLVIKKFHARFLELATSKPRDQNLRAPLLSEIIDAEKEAWHAVAELMQEGRWSLNDSLSEVTYCRQGFHTALSPRPKAVQSPQNDDRRRRRLPSPVVPKARAKTKPEPKKGANQPASNSDTKKYLDSWARKLPDGRGICIRYHTGKYRKMQEWQFLQICPRLPHHEQWW